MARKLDLSMAPAYRPDDNVATYRPDDDGRNNAGEKIHYVPLNSLHSSRHQTRLVTDLEADALLADDIDARGLIHVPLVRPHSELTGAYEIVAGHRRVSAVGQLAREGRGASVLRGTGEDPGERLIPVIIRDIDELTAHGVTVSENFVREGLQPWEQAIALERLRHALERQGDRGSVRGVAAHLDISHQTIGPYLWIARAITEEVLAMAGLRSQPDTGVEPVLDERPMCRLSLAALQRAASQKNPSERARVLRLELAKTDPEGGDSRGAATPVATDPANPDPVTPKERGLQVNIRRPIGSLSAEEARRYLERLAPALGALVEVARDASPGVFDVPLADGRRLLVRVRMADEAPDG